MNKRMMVLMLSAGVMSAVVSSGCTQLPTEKQSVSDTRPLIAFKADDERVRAARVLLDGLDMGMVGDYIDGVASLRILPGTHTVRVVSGSEVFINEKVYVGDGVSRTFIVK